MHRTASQPDVSSNTGYQGYSYGYPQHANNTYHHQSGYHEGFTNDSRNYYNTSGYHSSGSPSLQAASVNHSGNTHTGYGGQNNHYGSQTSWYEQQRNPHSGYWGHGNHHGSQTPSSSQTSWYEQHHATLFDSFSVHNVRNMEAQQSVAPPAGKPIFDEQVYTPEPLSPITYTSVLPASIDMPNTTNELLKSMFTMMSNLMSAQKSTTPQEPSIVLEPVVIEPCLSREPLVMTESLQDEPVVVEAENALKPLVVTAPTTESTERVKPITVEDQKKETQTSKPKAKRVKSTASGKHKSAKKKQQQQRAKTTSPTGRYSFSASMRQFREHQLWFEVDPYYDREQSIFQLWTDMTRPPEDYDSGR